MRAFWLPIVVFIQFLLGGASAFESPFALNLNIDAFEILLKRRIMDLLVVDNYNGVKYWPYYGITISIRPQQGKKFEQSHFSEVKVSDDQLQLTSQDMRILFSALTRDTSKVVTFGTLVKQLSISFGVRKGDCGEVYDQGLDESVLHVSDCVYVRDVDIGDVDWSAMQANSTVIKEILEKSLLANIQESLDDYYLKLYEKRRSIVESALTYGPVEFRSVQTTEKAIMVPAYE